MTGQRGVAGQRIEFGAQFGRTGSLTRSADNRRKLNFEFGNMDHYGIDDTD